MVMGDCVVYRIRSKIVRLGLPVLFGALVCNLSADDKIVDTRIRQWIADLGDKKFAVRQTAHQHLAELGKPAFSQLKQIAQSGTPEQRFRAREIIRSVNWRTLHRGFLALSQQQDDQMDLEEGMILIMEFGFPHVERRQVCDTLDQMAHELLSRIFPQDPPIEVVQKLTHFLFFEKAFSGNRQNYYHSDNSYLNKVLELKTGLPITLSALCVLLGKRLRRPISGVGLPGHFIVRHVDQDGKGQLIDVFNEGQRLTREDAIKLAAEHSNQPFQDAYLAPVPSRQILIRMLNNLMSLAQQKEDKESMLRYVELLMALDSHSVQNRGMRSILRFETGRKKSAIADLDWFLDHEPENLDLDRIRQMREYFSR